MPVGAFLGGLLGRELGLVPTLWLGAGLMTLAVVPVFFSPLTGMRLLPTSMDALTADA